ncbi:MAG: hypothetical protein U0V87_00655 [Acidobacteriota bacterium]
MKSHQCSRLILGMVFIALAATPVLATERTFGAFIDGPLVIGDQVFSGGSLSLVPVGHSSQLTAVRLDGRQVALLFSESPSRRSDIARAAKTLVLTKDEHGLYRIIGLTYERDDRGSTLRPFRLSSVAQGVAVESVISSPETATASATR